MSFEKEENEFLREYKKTRERLDNLYWKKHSNWYFKFKNTVKLNRDREAK